MSVAVEHVNTPKREVQAARRRAGLVAAVAGLVLVPWFLLTQAVVELDPDPPPLGAPGQDFVDFYVENHSRIPLNVTLFIGQWVIVLVLLVAVVRAACVRLDLAALLAITLAGASTAIYVAAEGVLLWPALPSSDMDGQVLGDTLDASLAQAAVLPRDGLHAPASVLLGVSALVIAWLLAKSDLWGHWAMSLLGALAGAFALSSLLVGPEGFGPGFIFVLWGPVTATPPANRPPTHSKTHFGCHHRAW
jgi:hypothetical protein